MLRPTKIFKQNLNQHLNTDHNYKGCPNISVNFFYQLHGIDLVTCENMEVIYALVLVKKSCIHLGVGRVGL